MSTEYLEPYTTTAGDTWSRIAKRVYGNEMKVHHLYKENPDYIDVWKFDAGITIRVPAIPQESKNVPPWKRG